jgi:flagellar hook-associated protein FlgK
MSATTEKITEQINQIKEQIKAARAAGRDVAPLESQHEGLVRQLTAAANALNENKQILKG